MNTKADWFVVVGFLSAAVGVSLRIFMTMRYGDAHPVNGASKNRRDITRAYGSAFPKSWLPLAMRISLYTGVVLLIAGFLLEFR